MKNKFIVLLDSQTCLPAGRLTRRIKIYYH